MSPAVHAEFEFARLDPCQADPALVRQVWTNLVSNALKYTGRRRRARAGMRRETIVRAGHAPAAVDLGGHLLADETGFGERLRVLVDTKDIKSADKRWNWVRRGAPIIVEIGPRRAIF